MKFTAKTIADYLEDAKIIGNPDREITAFAKIEEGKKGTISFLANPKYYSYLYTTKSSIVIVNEDMTIDKPVFATLIVVKDAYQAFAKLLEMYAEYLYEPKIGVEKPSFIHDTASLGDNIYIGAFTYISNNVKIGDNVQIYPQVYIGENVTIGNNCILFPGTKIYHDCSIGDNCILHGGVVIGADGFGFAPNKGNQFKKVMQIGNVQIGNNVEIGANTTIDRATLGSTIIKNGVKLDNLIQIAHNVVIEENTVIAALTGISGSTKIGANCMIGGQVGMVGHIEIADEVKIAAQSGIAKAVKQKGATLLGSPAVNALDYQKSYVVFKNLPNILDEIRQLKKEINELKSAK